ncbi:MAG: D-alanyl-D-alanine carboxypeptidase family protein [Eubacteriales bacterium]|nr:D-alanyl-D-alanine carboxypeptidase family protein [Eubacteriales bacterium]
MKKRGFPYTIVGIIVTCALLVAILIVALQTRSIRRTYQGEAQITSAPTLAPPTLFARPTEVLLRLGSVSPEVKSLQTKLKELGYYAGDVDGQYGNGTREAVVLFQQQHDLDADGLVGETTLDVLYGPLAHAVVVTPEPVLPQADQDDLPLLVNRTHFLPDAYAAKKLVVIEDVLPDNLAVIKEAGERAEKEAVEALAAMLEAAHADGLTVWQVSEGYRTLEEQLALFEAQKQKYLNGEETGSALSPVAAEKETEHQVARPGTSEHHTGLAFDITVPGRSFADTEQSTWLAENCWEYGFIIRYQNGKEGVTGFSPEPWHIRYVGKQHSLYMEQTGLALEEYLLLFE